MNRRLTLRMIESGCRQYGPCKLWRGRVRAETKTPTSWHSGNDENLRKVVYALAHGLEMAELPKGRVFWPECGEPLCLERKHIVSSTWKQYCESLAERGRYSHFKANLSRTVARRRVSKLTPEIVGWIKESTQSLADIAHAVDMGKSSIGRIKRDQAWTELAWRAPSSVFELGGLHSPLETGETV